MSLLPSKIYNFLSDTSQNKVIGEGNGSRANPTGKGGSRSGGECSLLNCFKPAVLSIDGCATTALDSRGRLQERWRERILIEKSKFHPPLLA